MLPKLPMLKMCFEQHPYISHENQNKLGVMNNIPSLAENQNTYNTFSMYQCNDPFYPLPFARKMILKNFVKIDILIFKGWQQLPHWEMSELMLAKFDLYWGPVRPVMVPIKHLYWSDGGSRAWWAVFSEGSGGSVFSKVCVEKRTLNLLNSVKV